MARQPTSGQRFVTTTEIRRNLSAIIRRLRKSRDHAIIQSSGAPVAVLLSMAEYERLTAYGRRKAALHDFSRHFGQEVERLGLSEEEFMADLEKTKREVFAEQYGRPA